MFHFTIRDVLWVTVVVGLSVALWIDRTKHQADLETLDESERSYGMLWEAVRREGYNLLYKPTGIWLIPDPADQPNPYRAMPPVKQAPTRQPGQLAPQSRPITVTPRC